MPGPFDRSRSAAMAAVLAFSLSCSTSAQSAATLSPDTVVASIGDRQLTLGQVDQAALEQQARSFSGLTLEQALYEARRATIEQTIDRMLIEAEAADRGMDGDTLTQLEITSKVVPPTDAEVADWYRSNPERVRGATLDQVRDPIVDLLVQERSDRAKQTYLAVLKAKTPVRITLEPPRTEVADAGRPARGPSDAPITIIEFSDFQCPYCLQAKATVDRVLASFGDRIRFVYRHLPLPNHANAIPAAEASMCAAEQDRFWPFHDHLFANQSELSAEALKRYAATLGLDTNAFNSCFDGRKYRAEVEEDMAAAKAIGITGTPAFFINGRPIGGAQPYEVFEHIIADELARR